MRSSNSTNQARKGALRSSPTKNSKWTNDIQTAEDGPILAQAESLANSGNLEAAVSMAQRIGAGRALSAKAREESRDWQAQLQAAANLAAAQKLAASGTPRIALRRDSSRRTCPQKFFLACRCEIGNGWLERSNVRNCPRCG